VNRDYLSSYKKLMIDIVIAPILATKVSSASE